MQETNTTESSPNSRTARFSPQRRNLFGACLAHMLHDGYTDQLYALLPVWQSEFGLSYAGLAVVRALYYGTMGGLQVPGNRLMAKLGPRMALALSAFVAAAGYLVMAIPCGFPTLCIGLVVAGIGSSVQHPRASLLVTDTYGKASRGPLGIYNFAGDLGKVIFPAAVALLLPIFAWRPVVVLMSLIGLAVAAVLLALVPRQPFTALLMMATLVLPLVPMLAVLPVLGIVLNGTSSVLYGTVPDLAPKGDIGRGFAQFYTGVIGAGGLAPIGYGLIADHSNRTVGIVAAALTAAVIIPLILALRPILGSQRRISAK
jgi:MFS family permease